MRAARFNARRTCSLAGLGGMPPRFLGFSGSFLRKGGAPFLKELVCRRTMPLRWRER